MGSMEQVLLMDLGVTERNHGKFCYTLPSTDILKYVYSSYFVMSALEGGDW
jgi:hypothetical protein